MARSGDREAPWRAQELVQRMEELDRQEALQITSSSYSLLTETWLNSSEPISAQKVLRTVERMINSESEQNAPDMASCQLILRIMEEHKVDNTTMLLDMVSLILKQQWNCAAEQAEVQRLLENTMEMSNVLWPTSCSKN